MRWNSNQFDNLDSKLLKFSEDFDIWFEQFPKDNKALVEILLNHFEYYSHQEVNKQLKELYSQLKENFKIEEENTIFSFIKSKDGISNSSNDYWNEFKYENNINCNLCYENINVIEGFQWKFIDNIVFVDDCIGTGNSFISFLLPNVLKFKNKNLFFVTIHAMVDGIKEIKKFGIDNDINIIIIKYRSENKAFNSDYFSNNEDAIDDVMKMSLGFKIPKNQILGYKESQSLMAFYNNTPNNTLGFFRYNTDNYVSIFPRINSKKPSWQNMKKSKNNRNNLNYLIRRNKKSE